MVSVYLLAALSLFSQFPDTFLGSVSVGNGPADICFSPVGDRAYVAVSYGFVTVIDIDGYDDFTFSSLVSIDGEPCAVQCDDTGDVLYVADAQNSTVHLLDTGTMTVTGSFPVESSPVDMVLSSPAGRIFLSHSGGMVTVMGTSTSSVEEVFWAGNSLNGLTVSPDEDMVYAADNGSSLETAIDCETLAVNRFTSGMDSRSSAVSGNGEVLYLSSTSWDILMAMDTGELEEDTTISCPEGAPEEMRALPELPYLYGLHEDPGGFSVYSASNLALLGTVDIPGGPVNFEVHPDGERLFVVCDGSNSVRVYGYDPAGVQGDADGFTVRPLISPSPAPSLRITGAEGPVSITVFDVSGRILTEGSVTNPSEGETVNLPGLPSGIVVVRAECGATAQSLKLVVLQP